MLLIKVTISVIVCMLLLSCNDKPADTADTGTKKIKEKTITIAILPEQNVFEQKKRYRPLAEYLSNALDVNVKIKLLDSYGSVYDEIKNRAIDCAFFGSFNYVLIQARADLQPIARPVDANGNSSYRGIIFTRKDTKLKHNVDSWKGKRIALVHEVTTAGYIFPRWYLKRHGINNFESYFSKTIFAGSHDAAILSVLKGQADIGAAKDLVFDKLISENPAIRDDMVILAGSIPVPSNSLCVRGDMDNRIKESLKNILLSMHEKPEGINALKPLNAARFKETLDSDFDALRDMARDLNIDIRTYQFRHRQ